MILATVKLKTSVPRPTNVCTAQILGLIPDSLTMENMTALDCQQPPRYSQWALFLPFYWHMQSSPCRNGAGNSEMQKVFTKFLNEIIGKGYLRLVLAIWWLWKGATVFNHNWRGLSWILVSVFQDWQLISPPKESIIMLFKVPGLKTCIAIWCPYDNVKV